ncbi:MAG TPA: RsmB/NOP family class I SAM-dependent RNA methyltransferase [Bacilli bacterium]
MGKLPELFVEKMASLLGDEAAQFFASYDRPRHYGLRLNTLKISRETFCALSPFPLSPVPWCGNGFYYHAKVRPGKHPYYYAGLYYIQEPSAMSAAELLAVQPGDKVLDLCAAPGGKTTQLAAKLQGQGLIVANDISAERVKALVKNIELFGVRNAVVLNETPERLMRPFSRFFNKILLDAPCSGEGMFRKDDDMPAVWSPDSVKACAAMQRDILETAVKMLAPGGTIVYSTCTFSPEENEAQIAAFLQRHPAFSVVPYPADQGFSPGRPEWVARVTEAQRPGDEMLRQQAAVTKHTARIWPHRVAGEGHFIAILRHNGEGASKGGSDDAPISMNGQINKQTNGHGHLRKKPQKPRKELAEAFSFTPLYDFAAQLGIELPPGKLVSYGEYVYVSPGDLPDLDGLKVARPGWYVGNIRNKRFIPSQALAMGLKACAIRRTVNFAASSLETERYLKGDTLEIAPERIETAPGVAAKGYCLVCTDGYPLGWGKYQDGILKNEYPAGWRWIW